MAVFYILYTYIYMYCLYSVISQEDSSLYLRKFLFGCIFSLWWVIKYKYIYLKTTKRGKNGDGMASREHQCCINHGICHL